MGGLKHQTTFIGRQAVMISELAPGLLLSVRPSVTGFLRALCPMLLLFLMLHRARVGDVALRGSICQFLPLTVSKSSIEPDPVHCQEHIPIR
jgi:hypothetical protein